MGTMVSISIGNYDFMSEKNTFGDLLLPFSKESLHIEKAQNEMGEAVTKRYFRLSAADMKSILDYMGYSLDAAKSDFENSKESLVYVCRLIEKREECDPTADEVERLFSFDEWCSAVKKYAKVLANDTFDDSICKYLALEEERKKPKTVAEEIVIRSLPFGYFGFDYEDFESWNIFRVVVEAFSDDEDIILDYTELFEAGWCEEVPHEEEYCPSKTIVLTEGKFDAEVISESMLLLYPHMAKFFSFIDFDAYKVQGSTNFVTHYFKLFASLGIKNNVIALYDNDAAGIAEMMTLKQMRFPKNFMIMSLPDLDIAKHYPSLSNDEIVYQDVNGRACSIEMFLGRDVLKEGEKLPPVDWEAFMPKAGARQGKLQHKKSIQERFRSKLKAAKESGVIENDSWQELRILLQRIFSATHYKDE